jgi:glycosyltransferase involved in cell wall biosynthesis
MSSTSPPAPGRQEPRIAYITTAFPWRSETAVIKEIYELEELGFSIQVFSLKRTSFDGTFDPKAFRFRDRTHYPGPVVWIRSLLLALVHLALRAPYRRLLGLTLRRSGRHLGKNLYILLLLVPDIARRLRRDGTSYIHANFASYQAFAALGVHRLTGIPFGFTVHAHDIFLDSFLIGEKVAEAALVVSISRYNVDYMQRHFQVAPERVRVVHCGVDLAEFSPSDAPAGGAPMILSVGRMDPMKGFDTLLDACAELRQQMSFRCVLVGSGPERAALQARADGLGLNSTVEFRSGVPQEELVALYRDCHLYVQPCRRTSQGMQDGIPATLMEAMAVAKPTVSTYVSGIPELIEDGVEGRLVQPEDPAALCAAVRELLEDPERCRRMGQAGRRRIEEEFNIAVSARELGALLTETLARGAAGGGRE